MRPDSLPVAGSCVAAADDWFSAAELASVVVVAASAGASEASRVVVGAVDPTVVAVAATVVVVPATVVVVAATVVVVVGATVVVVVVGGTWHACHVPENDVSYAVGSPVERFASITTDQACAAVCDQVNVWLYDPPKLTTVATLSIVIVTRLFVLVPS
jgi:hypothetical protein